MRLYIYARKAKEKILGVYILVICFFLYVLYIVLQYFFYMLLQSPVLGGYTYKS